ncbi:MAG: 3-hexulose-6-phosphate synthase [Candidatus Diapherotrites archaeon]|nr:3-hexulose-6-phosphate synthase [Candidatus Diapherotrites archaeon]
MNEYKLQLALDFLEMKPALEMARKVAEYMDVLEAGTPLVKSVGLDIVRNLKKEFPDKEVEADLKTADVGYMEAEMAFKAGADIMTVMAASPHETVQGALDAGRDYKKKVMVDFIGCKSVVERYTELKDLGIKIDYLLVHAGIDQQMKGKSPLESLSQLHEKNLTIACAGGLNENTIPKVMALGATHLIVGGAITGSKNPVESARKMRESIEANNQ